MSSTMHIQKKREIEYTSSGFFRNGTSELHNLLDCLNINYTSESDYPEFDKNFEINKKSLVEGVKKLVQIDNGNDPDDVDVFHLTDCLDDAEMSLKDLIKCFNWMLENSAPGLRCIYVNFY